jgi:hypothetical protein
MSLEGDARKDHLSFEQVVFGLWSLVFGLKTHTTGLQPVVSQFQPREQNSRDSFGSSHSQAAVP